MLTKMKLAIVLCASMIGGVAAAQGTATAPAGPGRGVMKQMKQKYDLNHDGTLDAQERATLKTDMKAKRIAMRQALITRFDTNRDGTLDATEKTAAHKAKKAELFKKLDVNSDGSISFAEFESAKLGKLGKGKMGHGKGGFGGRGGNKHGRGGLTK